MPLGKIEKSLGRLRGLEIAMSTALLDIADETRQRMRDDLDAAIANAYENTSLTQSCRNGLSELGDKLDGNNMNFPYWSPNHHSRELTRNRDKLIDQLRLTKSA